MLVELVQITPNAERLIAQCARVSYGKFLVEKPLEEDRKLIRRLIELGHHSVLEHAVATFLIVGISRACAAQLTRHRLMSVVQESFRRVYAGDRGLVIPPTWGEEEREMGQELFGACIQVYDEMIKSGVPLEDARYVLPMGIATELVLTANFRELRHIISLRAAPDAQWEIREVARRMLKILHEKAPSVFEDLLPLLGDWKPETEKAEEGWVGA